MSPLPYPVKYKKPLTYLSLEDWNNFVANLLWINQYGSYKWLQYYQNGSFKNLNEVFAKTLSVSQLLVNGYKALHNLSSPEAYTFPLFFETMIKTQQVLQAWQDLINKLGTVSFKYPTAKLPELKYVKTPELPLYLAEVLGVEEFKFLEQLPELLVKVYQMVPKIASKIVLSNIFAGTQFNFSGSATLEQLIEDYLDPSYLSKTREAIIENLGSYPVLVNGTLYLMPKNCMKVTVSDFSQLQFQAQSPTLLTLGVSLLTKPTLVYAITITNSQSSATPSDFQQLLQLDLSDIISSPSQLLNLLFCLDINCHTPIYALVWLYSSDLSTVYVWVKLPNSIPANSSITIYMAVTNNIQYPYTGVNAYYDSDHDNGSYVFDAYINAMGTQYLPSNLEIYSNVYSSIQFTPKSGSTPGYILMVDDQSNAYTVVYLPTTNAGSVNEIFESTGYYDGSADQQGILFLGNEPKYYFCGNTDHGQAVFFSDGYAVTWDPFTGNSYIWSGCNIENYGSENFTSSGYNFYQAIVYSNEIEFNGTSISSPLVEIPELKLSTEVTWSVSWPYSVVANGSSFGQLDGTGGAYHVGYFYWARARKIPPNNTMPSNSQPQKVAVIG